MEGRNTGSIFSEEFRRKLRQFGKNVRNDSVGRTNWDLFKTTGFTVLIVFWMIFGVYGEKIYINNWVEQYPNVPLSASYIWHLLNFMNIITQIFIIVVWVFTVLHIIILEVTEQNESKKPNPVLSRTSVETPEGTEETITELRECKYCGSTKTRPAGKEHPGKKFCKSCKRFF